MDGSVTVSVRGRELNHGEEALVTALGTTEVTKLDLHASRLALGRLIDDLLSHRTLVDLDVSSNIVDPPALCRLLTSPTLRRLNLSECGIDADDLVSIAASLRRNAVLQDLKLRGNCLCGVSPAGRGVFNPRGLGALVAAVQVHPELRLLDLSATQLCGVTGSWLPGKRGSFQRQPLDLLLTCTLLTTNLTDLILSDNGIVEAGGKPLLDDFTNLRYQGGRAGFHLITDHHRPGGRPSCILHRSGPRERR